MLFHRFLDLLLLLTHVFAFLCRHIPVNMELKDVIQARTSVRNFLPDAIPMEDVREIVRLAACAPSVNNYQPWRFYAISRKSLLEEMADIVYRKIQEIPSNESRVSQNVKSQVEWFSTFFRNAPLVIAISMESYETVLEKSVGLSHDEINRQRNFPDIQSAGAAIQNLLLAAVDMGYGACWMSAPMIACSDLESMIGIEKTDQLIAFVALGRPANPPKPREKKNVDEILRTID